MGWNGSGGKSLLTTVPKNVDDKMGLSRPYLRGLIAGLVCISIVAVAIYIFLRSNDQTEIENSHTKSTLIQEFTPTPIGNSKTDESSSEIGSEKSHKKQPPVYEKKPGQMQLPDGKILTFPPPKEGQTSKVYAYGHLYECDHLGNFRDISKRKLFSTAFEGNLFAMANGGQYISAFLKGLDDQQVLEILKKEYIQIGDETEEELSKLMAYNEMRKAAISYIEEGGKFDEFISEIEKFDKSERRTQLLGYSSIMNLVKEGNIQEAREMLDAANILLEKKGCNPMQLPPHIEKLLKSDND